ncbi:hypothetical protein [Lactococcus phage P087]|uniref:Uncharacterized protein n=1 Tax=Lactococcus phage P087 TaxID=641487 RepID=C3U2K8_9CAUD|nr:hypothetical protein P087_gp18 [Lactococcus phage P087]ACP41694.1 hypothetical protein [Lactococcus phage P087]
MIKLKLIDVKLDIDTDATFGTCELCMSYGHTVEQPTYIFEDVATKETHIIDGYWWSWGDYDDITVDNVIAFADWISQQDFDNIMWEESGEIFTYEWLQHVVYKYNKVQRAEREAKGYKY